MNASQSPACRPIQLILFGSFADKTRVLAGKVGAIDAVLAIMRAHADNAGVFEQACLTMKHVCCEVGALVALNSALVSACRQFGYIDLCFVQLKIKRPLCVLAFWSLQALEQVADFLVYSRSICWQSWLLRTPLIVYAAERAGLNGAGDVCVRRGVVPARSCIGGSCVACGPCRGLGLVGAGGVVVDVRQPPVRSACAGAGGARPWADTATTALMPHPSNDHQRMLPWSTISRSWPSSATSGFSRQKLKHLLMP
jgi:hypothetical protein